MPSSTPPSQNQATGAVSSIGRSCWVKNQNSTVFTAEGQRAGWRGLWPWLPPTSDGVVGGASLHAPSAPGILTAPAPPLSSGILVWATYRPIPTLHLIITAEHPPFSKEAPF